MIDLGNKLVKDFISEENYDAIQRIKDFEEREKRRTLIYKQFAKTVVPK